MFITYILIRPHLLNDNNPIWTRSYRLHDDINVLSSDNRTIYIAYILSSTKYLLIIHDI